MAEEYIANSGIVKWCIYQETRPQVNPDIYERLEG